MGLIGGLVTDLLGGSTSSASAPTAAATSTTAAAVTTSAVSSTGKSDTTSSSTKDKATSTSATASASTSADKSTSATSATAKSSITSTAAATSTSVSSSSITSASAVTSSTQSASTDNAAASTASPSTSTSDSASPTESATSTSAEKSNSDSNSKVTSTITASASGSASSTGANAAALNAASKDTSGSNILDPDNKLFPLGIVIVILGGLFVIVATAVLFIRLFGWNRKRRNLRGAIPSFIESDPSFEPKSFETITTNIAGTSTRGYQPMQINTSLPSTLTNQQQGGYIMDEPTARPQRNQYYPQAQAQRGITGNPYENAFFPRTPNGGGADGMLSPNQQQQQQQEQEMQMGSPVPSFHTGRAAYENPAGTVGYPGRMPSQPQPQTRQYEPTRSNTKYSTTSSRSAGSSGSGGGSAGSRVLGANPSQAYGMGISFNAYPQRDHRRSGSGESFKSTSSGKSGRSGRSDGSQGHRKLGKEQPWTMDVQGV